MYRVYGKRFNETKFKPFDMDNNVFVTTLIHASLFTDSQLDELKEEINNMNINNVDYKFEIIRV